MKSKATEPKAEPVKTQRKAPGVLKIGPEALATMRSYDSCAVAPKLKMPCLRNNMPSMFGFDS